MAGVDNLNQEADAAAVALGDEGYAERSLTLVATFDTNADALRAAGSIALEAPARMLILDRILVAYHLVPDPEDDPVPVATQLTGLGADVLVQGDRFGEGQVVADVTCRAADHDAAATIAAPLADYPIGRPIRPPALGRSSADRRRGARSVHLPALGDRLRGSLRERSVDAPVRRPIPRGRLRGRVRGTERRAAGSCAGAPGRRHRGRGPPGGGGPAGVDAERHGSGRVHRMAARAEPPDGTVADVERRAAQAGWISDRPPIWRALGQSTTASKLAGSPSTGSSWGSPGLLAYLDQQGCDDVRVRLTDYDEVRLD